MRNTPIQNVNKRRRATALRLVCLLLCLLTVAGLLAACTPVKEKQTPPPAPPAGRWKFDHTGCSFYDKFEGSTVDPEKWDFQTGDGSDYGNPGWGNNEQQYYRSENAVIEDGYLKIKAEKEDFGNKKYTSSKLVTKGRFSQLYGRFEAKIRLSKSIQGLWPAFWMMPASSVYGGWPRSGEIDIMELKGRLPTNASSAIHFGGSGNHRYLYQNYTLPADSDITAFHLYSVDWTPGVFKFYIDGNLYQTYKREQWFTTSDPRNANAPFDQDFYLILNLAIGGNFDGNLLPPDDQMPAELIIDYVRVYPQEAIPDDFIL